VAGFITCDMGFLGCMAYAPGTFEGDEMSRFWHRHKTRLDFWYHHETRLDPAIRWRSSPAAWEDGIRIYAPGHDEAA